MTQADWKYERLLNAELTYSTETFGAEPEDRGQESWAFIYFTTRLSQKHSHTDLTSVVSSYIRTVKKHFWMSKHYFAKKKRSS